MTIINNIINNVSQTPKFLLSFPQAAAYSIPNLINAFKGNSQDVVAILDSSYNQVFQLARAVKINVSPSSKLMDHPVENGSVRTDFRIINPLEIELSVICSGQDYQQVYNEIRQAFLAGNLYFVSCRADTYINMMISAIPHDEVPDMFDVIALGIKMREVIQVETQYQPLTAKKVKHVNDQSTVNSGTVTPTAPPPSLAAQGLDALKKLIH